MELFMTGGNYPVAEAPARDYLAGATRGQGALNGLARRRICRSQRQTDHPTLIRRHSLRRTCNAPTRSHFGDQQELKPCALQRYSRQQ
jgi:hypothetical protein